MHKYVSVIIIIVAMFLYPVVLFRPSEGIHITELSSLSIVCQKQDETGWMEMKKAETGERYLMYFALLEIKEHQLKRSLAYYFYRDEELIGYEIDIEASQIEEDVFIYKKVNLSPEKIEYLEKFFETCE